MRSAAHPRRAHLFRDAALFCRRQSGEFAVPRPRSGQLGDEAPDVGIEVVVQNR